MQLVGTSLTAFVTPQLYNCGILPTTNTLVPEVVFVVIWNVTGTYDASANARVAANSNAVQSSRFVVGILTIVMNKNLFFARPPAKVKKPRAFVKEARRRNRL